LPEVVSVSKEGGGQVDRRCQHTLWGLSRVLVRELDLKLEEAALPHSLLLARD